MASITARLGITVSTLLMATTLLQAAPAAPGQPVATIVAVEGATTTYQSQAWHGQPVTVQVPSQAAADIKDSDAQGTVRATVSAVDTTTNRIKVHTSEGQTIVLEMAPPALTSLQVGDPFLFTVPTAPR